MYDIFLSYSTQDRGRLRPLFDALAQQGWSVFWDHQSIHTGENWHRKIDESINNSRCVVVVWSKQSVQSEWVLEEASKGKARNVLLPIKIDGIEPPFGFALRQTGDFTRWNGKPDHPAFIELAAQIYSLLGAGGNRPPPLPPPPSRVGLWVTGLVAVSAVGGYVYTQRQPEHSAPPPVVSVPVAEPVAPNPAPAPPPATKPEPAAAKAQSPLEPEMVPIPAGSFTMGCDGKRDDVEGGCEDDEKPAHKVTLAAFKLAKTEVTVAQFRAFADATGYRTTAETAGSCYSLDEKGAWGEVKGNSWRKLGFQQTDNDPVACVSWDDAQKYLEWLNGEIKPEKPYRLPTEAEWEYAARGDQSKGDKEGAFPWGQKGSDGCSFANMADQAAKEKYPDWTWVTSCNDGYIYTAPVGSFKPDGYGLYDMQGNVWEWVQDRYADDYYKSSPASAPQGPGSGSARVIRGGSWGFGPWFVRSAYRFRNSPDFRDFNVGFRLSQGQ